MSAAGIAVPLALRFLAKQDALDNVLLRPFSELGLPPGGVQFR